MQKIILLSVMVAMIALPIAFAGERHPVRSLKKTMLVIVVFNLLYMLAMRFGYTHLE